jgi:hypothetical protein
MESRFVGDSLIRNCSFGMAIFDLICADSTSTICCCNNFTRKSAALCKLPNKLTANQKYSYVGFAKLEPSTATTCQG